MLQESYLERFLKHRLNPEIGIDAAALDRFSNAEFSRIAENLHEHKLAITLHGPFIDLSAGSTDPAVRQLTRNRLKQLLKLVPLFRPQTVVCHAGYDRRRYGFFKEAWTENSLDMWSWLATRLTAEGARLMLENVYEDRPEDILNMFERLEDQGVGFCLDSGHMSAFGKAPLQEWLQVLGPWIGQLHLHDNHGDWDDHLALGRGNIDFPLIFDYLKGQKISGPVITLEPHKEADLWPSLEYLQRHWDEH
jgi:sugar phosphate isomerase/epimerase